jgi:hypothetical protein
MSEQSSVEDDEAAPDNGLSSLEKLKSSSFLQDTLNLTTKAEGAIESTVAEDIAKELDDLFNSSTTAHRKLKDWKRNDKEHRQEAGTSKKGTAPTSGSNVQYLGAATVTLTNEEEAERVRT